MAFGFLFVGDISTDRHIYLLKSPQTDIILLTGIKVIFVNKSLYTVLLRSPFISRSLSTDKRCIEVYMYGRRNLNAKMNMRRVEPAFSVEYGPLKNIRKKI